MIKNILHTVGSKVIIALFSFFILLINARALGPKGVGTIGLIILGITLFQLISNVFNSGIIYFGEKLNTQKVVVTTYLWSLITVLLFWLVNLIYPVFEQDYSVEIYLLALLQSFTSIHTLIIIGKEDIPTFNYITLIKSATIFCAVCIQFFFLENTTVDAFVTALFIAYLLTYILSILYSFKYLNSKISSTYTEVIKSYLSYGTYIQLAGFFQLLNYRLSYYILDAFSGRAALGIYSGGVQVSEALVLPGKSIATVQYARISKRNNRKYAQRISAFFLKLSVLATFCGVLLIFVLPEFVYLFLFGEKFVGIKISICILSIGILFQSAEIVLSHYFSGTGQQKLNSNSAFIGLTATLIGGFLLIPQYNAIGAAITSTLSYFSMLIYLGWCMRKQNIYGSKIFLIQKRDINLVKRLFKKR